MKLSGLMVSALWWPSLLGLALPALTAAGGAPGNQREVVLTQVWGRVLDGAGSAGATDGTPVTRVVNLLKTMLATMRKEMQEDETLHQKLVCWCDTNRDDKSLAMKNAKRTVAILESEIERLAALISNTKELVRKFKLDISSGEQELATITALHEKKIGGLRKDERDLILSLESLKAATMVLQKHHMGSFSLAQLGNDGDSMQVNRSDSSEAILLEVGTRRNAVRSPDDTDLDQALSVMGDGAAEPVPQAPGAQAASPDDGVADPAADVGVQKLLQFDPSAEAAQQTRQSPAAQDPAALAPDAGDDTADTAAGAAAPWLSRQDPAEETPRQDPADPTQLRQQDSAEESAQRLLHRDPAARFPAAQAPGGRADPGTSGSAQHGPAAVSVVDPTSEAGVQQFLQHDNLDSSLQQFLRQSPSDGVVDSAVEKSGQAFLRRSPAAPAPSGRAAAWLQHMSAGDASLVMRAVKSASTFVQAKADARGSTDYVPQYQAQSGEILGILKQMLEEMSDDLSDVQKQTRDEVHSFAKMKKAKTKELAAMRKQQSAKEDELAEAQMDLANDKEELGGQKALLMELTKFLDDLEKSCSGAEEDFQLRLKARMGEIKAVSEAIDVLTDNEARDATSGTYGSKATSLVQVSSRAHEELRVRAAALLRAAARKMKSSELAALATTVELDAFTKVKKAIDDMVVMLKMQQADEVKFNDWCKAELHETSMTTTQTKDLKRFLDAKVAELTSTVTELENEIGTAKKQTADLQAMLQTASVERQKANLEFQKTVADQRATQGILKMALQKLSAFYDVELLLQTGKKSAREIPMPRQGEYKANEGADAVIQVIEKLVDEARELEADSVKGEQGAQAQYEATVANTNDSLADLQAAILTSSSNIAQVKKDKRSTEADLADIVKELKGLSKYAADMHAECDYYLKSFKVRQQARADEIESLQQARAILGGADLT